MEKTDTRHVEGMQSCNGEENRGGDLEKLLVRGLLNIERGCLCAARKSTENNSTVLKLGAGMHRAACRDTRVS
jgi:hypothetical protein